MSLKVKLTPWQKEVLNDDHRFKVICAGRRAGKSVLARMWVLKLATEQEGLYWVVSPTYKQSKMIHWRELIKEVPSEWIDKKNEVELSITLKNGSVIELKGSENPDNLRGVKLRGLVIDEIASIRNWDWLWSEVLRPTLSDYEASAVFISTPKGFNHFYELFKAGQGEDTSYKSWRFTSYDNPAIPKGEIDLAKEEMADDYFYQEYMADFRKYTGLVYKSFERDLHVITPFDIPESYKIYRSCDFGSTNPTVFLWIAVDADDNCFVVGEHYETGRTIDFHAGAVNSHFLSKRVIQTYGDPSGAQWINEFSQRGVYITPASKDTGTSQHNWVRFGIEKVADRLQSKPGHFVEKVPADHRSLPRLFIFSSCIKTIEEFETYRWKEKSVNQAQDLNEPDQPEKANDHAMDALRYFCVSYSKPMDNYTHTPVNTQQWKIGA